MSLASDGLREVWERNVGRSVVILDVPTLYLLITYNVSLCYSYLVDPASSHMLVSKIKPCMCKYLH